MEQSKTAGQGRQPMLFHRQEIKRIIFKVRENEKAHTMTLREGKSKKLRGALIQQPKLQYRICTSQGSDRLMGDIF